MARKTKVGVCAHCGSSRDLTLEHIPPRGMFAKPRPTPLPVYTCKECNSESSALDEELKVLVGIVAYVRDNPDTKKLWSNVLRTLRHNKRLKHEVISNISKLDTEEHYRFGYAPDKLNPLMLKMARCLHFHHFEFLPPDDAEIRISWANEKYLVEDLQPDMIGGEVGNTEKFAYGYALVNEYPEHYGAVFQFIFYRVLVVTLLFTEAEPVVRGNE